MKYTPRELADFQSRIHRLDPNLTTEELSALRQFYDDISSFMIHAGHTINARYFGMEEESLSRIIQARNES